VRIVLQIISWVALALAVVPSALFLAGRMELDQVKWLMLLGAIVWFAVTPFWMDKKG
jgi:hypothetical protein